MDIQCDLQFEVVLSCYKQNKYWYWISWRILLHKYKYTKTMLRIRTIPWSIIFLNLFNIRCIWENNRRRTTTSIFANVFSDLSILSFIWTLDRQKLSTLIFSFWKWLFVNNSFVRSGEIMQMKTFDVMTTIPRPYVIAERKTRTAPYIYFLSCLEDRLPVSSVLDRQSG